MSKSKICPVCEEGTLSPEIYAEQFRHGGKFVTVAGLERCRCNVCSADPVSTEQIKRNQIRIADAKRNADRLLSGSEILAIRESLNLTQAEASMVFGGGQNAFSKYERGEVVQSVPMDRLLRAVASNRWIVHELANLAGIKLASMPSEDRNYEVASPLSAKFSFTNTSIHFNGHVTEVSNDSYFVEVQNGRRAAG